MAGADFVLWSLLCYEVARVRVDSSVEVDTEAIRNAVAVIHAERDEAIARAEAAELAAERALEYLSRHAEAVEVARDHTAGGGKAGGS